MISKNVGRIRLMGGWGSGRTGGPHLVEDALAIDLPSMLRRGLVRDGRSGSGRLRFVEGGERIASINFVYDLVDPDDGSLSLKYMRTTSRGDRQIALQRVRLTFTQPHYGGRRWWMICPYGGQRVAKLYLPPGGDAFASREEWRLGYASQRHDSRAAIFARLFRLQKKLGCEQLWGAEPSRPKGMWRKTFKRQFANYLQLDAACSTATDVLVTDLKNRFG